jgi:hypothetical protein
LHQLTAENQNFNAFCKQLEKLYEKDKTLKPQLDTMVEKAAVRLFLLLFLT